jgi:hypothetical protein
VFPVAVLLVAALAAGAAALLERAGGLRLAATSAPPHRVLTGRFIRRCCGGPVARPVRAAGELRVENLPDDEVEAVADELLDLRAALLGELTNTLVQVDAHGMGV